MLFAIVLTDGPDAPRLRAEHLSAHLDYVAGVMPQVRVAGPLYDTPGGTPSMSLYVVEADDATAAEAFLAGDPYFVAGVWREVSIRAFKAAAGTWVGGATWPTARAGRSSLDLPQAKK